MSSTAKAIAVARDLAASLAIRFPAGGAGLNTVRQAFDANGWPMIFVSHDANEAAGQAVVAIRIKGVDMVSKDVLGNSLTAYTPHTLEFAYEMSATAGLPIPTSIQLAIANYQAMNVGIRYQLKQIANATAVTEASINAKSADADLDMLYWPTKLG